MAAPSKTKRTPRGDRSRPAGEGWASIRSRRDAAERCLSLLMRQRGARRGALWLRNGPTWRLEARTRDLSGLAEELSPDAAARWARSRSSARGALGADQGPVATWVLRDRGELLAVAALSGVRPRSRPTPRPAAEAFEDAARLAFRAAAWFETLVDRTRELERTVATLGEAQRRAALVQTAAAVAHEIRNPLSVIAAHVDLLRGEREAQGAPDATLEVVAKKVAEANALLHDFLELSRPLSLEVRPVPLAPLLAGFEAFLGPKCRQQGVAFRCVAADGLAPVRADPNALQRCLLDLCLNALGLLGQGGRLDVEARPTSGGATLSVSDNGPGIPDEILPRLFEPYVTSRRGGTGLGLYNVRRICREMGAGVAAGRLDGPGSRFRIYLRRAEEAA